ncbi:MAG: hypothetical protein AB7F89_25865 [Pirellulaceae bacterium]
MNHRNELLIVLAAALVVRGAVLWGAHARLDADRDAYRRIAVVLRATGTYGAFFREDTAEEAATPAGQPTAFRPPLYPALLSILVDGDRLSTRAVAVWHLIWGVATVGLVYEVGRRWSLGRWSVFAALATTWDPILLNQSTQLMTETLAALLSIVCLAALTGWLDRESPEVRTSGDVDLDQDRPRNDSPNLSVHGREGRVAKFVRARSQGIRSLTLGLLVGVACLCRPTYQPWAALLLVALLITPASGTLRWWRAAVFLGGVAAVLLPWAARNYVQFGKFTAATSHGGYTILLGNNPRFYEYVRRGERGTVWPARELDDAWSHRAALRSAQDDLFAAPNRERVTSPDGAAQHEETVAPRGEFADDRLAYDYARRFIREDPSGFVRACLVRLGRFWQLVPHATTQPEKRYVTTLRWLVGLWYLAIYALIAVAIVGSTRRIVQWPWLGGLLLCVAFLTVHTLYWTDMRMRAPLVPYLALLAASGGQCLAAAFFWRPRVNDGGATGR